MDLAEQNQRQIEKPTKDPQIAARKRLDSICQTGIQFQGMTLNELTTLVEDTGLPSLTIDTTRRGDKEYTWYLLTKDATLCCLKYSPQGVKLDVLINNVSSEKISIDEFKILDDIQNLEKMNKEYRVGDFTNSLLDFFEASEVGQLIVGPIKDKINKVISFLGFK